MEIVKIGKQLAAIHQIRSSYLPLMFLTEYSKTMRKDPVAISNYQQLYEYRKVNLVATSDILSSVDEV